jgi:signal transduction histidine kinase
MSQFTAKSYVKNTILVVDDYEDNLCLIQNILEDEGHLIVLANNGFEALKKIEESPPDLILLDVMMPDFNGFEVTKKIRENKDLPFIPILLITAYDQPSVVTGLDSGADDFIKKPVSIDELLARVRSLLRLKNTIDERDAIARQREDFVSRLTHDLRTPLIAADRMYNLMSEGALGELKPEFAEVIDSLTRSNQNLLEMVNTLLEVYRYEADRKTIYFAPVNLTEIVKEVVTELIALAQQKQLEIKLELEKTEINGDNLELRRVITNLIGNAIKYTNRGTIIVKLIQDGDFVTFSVADTGQGISPEEQQWLFNRFSQGHHHLGGSGLGLHLSRQIVESHQGTINVQSQLGQGSLFTVNFPISVTINPSC